MRRIDPITYTTVWYAVDDLPTEAIWFSLAAAMIFADVIFDYRQILAVKVWQGDNPEDVFAPSWGCHPRLVYKKVKTSSAYFFHLQNTSHATIQASA